MSKSDFLKSGVTGIEKEWKQMDMTAKEAKKKCKKDILELQSKKGKFKKKLEDIAIQSETQDNDLKVLKDKVKEEVADLNKINKQIFDQEKQIKML